MTPDPSTEAPRWLCKTCGWLNLGLIPARCDRCGNEYPPPDPSTEAPDVKKMFLDVADEAIALRKERDALAARLSQAEEALRKIAYYREGEPFDVKRSYFKDVQDIARAALAASSAGERE